MASTLVDDSRFLVIRIITAHVITVVTYHVIAQLVVYAITVAIDDLSSFSFSLASTLVDDSRFLVVRVITVHVITVVIYHVIARSVVYAITVAIDD